MFIQHNIEIEIVPLYIRVMGSSGSNKEERTEYRTTEQSQGDANRTP